MYNRYIPQPDGSYRRSRMQEPHRPAPQKSPPGCPTPEPETPTPIPPPPRECPNHRRPHRPSPDTSISGFLHRILPRDFDTGDLLIIVLLLLMAGDCADDQNTALLTLALYFFM